MVKGLKQFLSEFGAPVLVIMENRLGKRTETSLGVTHSHDIFSIMENRLGKRTETLVANSLPSRTIGLWRIDLVKGLKRFLKRPSSHE